MSMLLIPFLVIALVLGVLSLRLALSNSWGWGVGIGLALVPLAATFFFGIMGLMLAFLIVGSLYKMA